MTWREQALCRDEPSDIFFPTTGQLATTALAFCQACQVTDQCLDYAMKANEPTGVWGGLTEIERRRRRQGVRRMCGECGGIVEYPKTRFCSDECGKRAFRRKVEG